MMPLLLQTTEKAQRIESTHYVEGYATTFEPYKLYEDSEGAVYESFSKEAFIGTDMSDVILQFDHSGRVFARMSNGSLIVEADEKGLFVAADLSRSESAKQLYEEIKAGLITKMSWAFRPGEYRFDKASRTFIHDKILKIYDVSAVSIPANVDTEINARAWIDGEIKKATEECRERERLALRISLELGVSRR